MKTYFAHQWEKAKFQFKSMNAFGWLVIALSISIPLISQQNTVATEWFAQVFCGVHLVTVIVLSYYFGFKGGLIIVALGTIHHIHSDMHFFESQLIGLTIGFFRAFFALSVGYIIGKVRLNEFNLGILNKRLEELNAKLAEQNITDGLTGLYNSKFFYDTLEQELNRAKRDNYYVSVLMLDIDNFKNYNDTLGHLKGDKLLKEFGAVLKQQSGESGIVARYGGEEFAIILPNISPERAKDKAAELRKSISEYPFAGRDVQSGGQITVSIGIATYPMHANSLTELLNCCDKMLYKVKNSTKNGIQLFGECD